MQKKQEEEIMKKKFITKALAAALSASMAFSMSSAVPMTAASAAAKVVRLNTTYKTLKVGQKDYKLRLVNNTLNWKIKKASTTDKKIAMVYGKKASYVLLKGKSTGRATIKLSLKTSARRTKNTKTLKCRVNVIAANQGQKPGTDPGTQKPVSASATVGTQAELDAALANAALTDITIRTDSAVNLTIPAGSHSSVNLTVDAPNASVTNSGVFKTIILASIKADTWTEKAQGNTFRVTASKARIVADTASKIAGVIVTKADADVVIVSNGTLGGITISAKAKVTLSGTAAENAALIPVTIEAAAAGAEFTASLPVAVQTAADAVIELQEKAEKSTISIVNESAVVTVKNNTNGYTVPVKRGNITRNVSKGTQVLKPSTATSQGGSTGGGYWGGGSGGSSGGSGDSGITVNKKQAKNQTELDKWLKDSSVTQITIVSSEAEADKEITIKSGTYRNIDLIVDAPEKTIVNEAVFKSVEIKDIATETWTEKARGNTLKISAPNPHIIVDKNASVSGISFTKPDKAKGGVMKRMKLDVQGTVNGAVSFGTLVKNADVKVAKGASLAKGVSFASGAGKSNVKLNVAGTVGDVSCNAADAKLTVTMEDNAASVGNVSVNAGMDVAIKAAEAVTNLAKQIAVVLKNAAAKLSSQVKVSVTVHADNASVVLSASAKGSGLTYGSGVTTAGISTETAVTVKKEGSADTVTIPANTQGSVTLEGDKVTTSPVAPTGIELNYNELNMFTSDSEDLAVSLVPAYAKASIKNVAWEVTEGRELIEVKADAEDSGKAVLTAKTKGTATVKVTAVITDQSKAAETEVTKETTLKVIVEDKAEANAPNPEPDAGEPSITVTPAKLEMTAGGEPAELTVSLNPADAKAEVTSLAWTIKDADGNPSDIVSVTKKQGSETSTASVTAAKAGTAVITAAASIKVEGKTEPVTKTAEVAVTVAAAQTPAGVPVVTVTAPSVSTTPTSSAVTTVSPSAFTILNSSITAAVDNKSAEVTVIAATPAESGLTQKSVDGGFQYEIQSQAAGKYKVTFTLKINGENYDVDITVDVTGSGSSYSATAVAGTPKEPAQIFD